MKWVRQVKYRVDHLSDVLLFVIGGNDYEAIAQGRFSFGSQIYGRSVTNEDWQGMTSAWSLINRRILLELTA